MDATYGQTYKFTGMDEKTRHINPSIFQKIMKWFADTAEFYMEKTRIQTTFGKLYENGDDYIGPHSDDEPRISKKFSNLQFLVWSSTGFCNKSKVNTFRKVFKMPNNSLIIMGEMQKYYKHSVPKRSVKKLQKLE